MPKNLNVGTTSFGKRNGEQMAKTMTSNESLTIHHTSNFLGREAGDNFRASSGLTQWVANNFELLFPDHQPPYDYRRVEGMTRDRWEQYSLDILKRWISNPSCRKIVRKSVNFNNTVQFLVFPHPVDAEAMNLAGPGGELPAALVNFKDLNEGQSCIASTFRKVPAPQIEATDMILTCPMSVRAAFNGTQAEIAPLGLVNSFHGLSSKVSEMEEELLEWKQFLDWMESSHSENRWEGEITRAEFVDSENPILRLYVQSEGRHLGLLKRVPMDYKRESSVFIKSKSDNETLAEEIQNDAGKVELGQAKRVKKQPGQSKRRLSSTFDWTMGSFRNQPLWSVNCWSTTRKSGQEVSSAKKTALSVCRTCKPRATSITGFSISAKQSPAPVSRPPSNILLSISSTNNKNLPCGPPLPLLKCTSFKAHPEPERRRSLPS